MRPYQSPKQRQRAAGPMQEDAAPPDMPQEPAANPPDAISAFIPKDFFGMPPKPGDSCTVMVKAVDPETGEVEVTKSEQADGEQSSPMEEMDKRFPPDEQG